MIGHRRHKMIVLEVIIIVLVVTFAVGSMIEGTGLSKKENEENIDD
jgi:flagellar basal body-associated protein FliL